MKIITSIHEMQAEAKRIRREGKTIGFVPTMGFLHQGHLTLIKNAKQDNDITVLSIFVNPLQFGPKEDLSSYPRNFEQDQALAAEQKTDIIFYPSVEEMYPSPLSVTVKVKERTDVLCGKSRPGHFDGVAAVLTKLFNIVLPDRVYFGMKDAQQIAVVDGLVRDFNFPLEIIPVETVREEDGLAKSSRNVNLLPDEREQAPVLFQSLSDAKGMIIEGERNPRNVISYMKEQIESKTDGIIDYIEVYSYPGLTEVTEIEGTIIIALAVKFSKARLIDNIIIHLK